MLTELVKQYMRVDYDDDDELIDLLLNTVLDEMEGMIPGFDRKRPTNRQKILVMASVKELYDNRDQRSAKPEALRAAISSMLIKETCR